MKTELRPLDFGEVLDRTIQIYRSRFLMFVGIVAFGSGSLLFWQAASLLLMRFLRVARSPTWISQIEAAAVEIFSLIVWAVVFSALYRAVADMYTDELPGVARSYLPNRSHWFRYIRLSIVRFALSLSSLGVPGVSLVVLSTGKQEVLRVVGFGGMTALFIISLLLFAVGLGFSVWLWFRYALAGAACVFEGIGIVQSFRRSATLSRGQRLRLFVVQLLGWTLEYVIYGLFMSPVIRFMIHHHGRIPARSQIPVLFLLFFIRVLVVPVTGIGWMVCYFDARIRQEGFDVEWMLQRSAALDASSDLLSPAT